MGFVAAKCTQCGANIDVDNTKEAGICKFCGTAFITEKAINNFNTYVTNNNNFSGATINVSNGYDVEGSLTLAQTAINSNNFEEAIKYLDEVLKLDHKNVKAWKLKADLTVFKESVMCGTNAINFSVGKEQEELKKYFYADWLDKCMIKDDCYIKGVPDKEIEINIELQNKIIQNTLKGINIRKPDWDDRHRRMASRDILNSEITSFNEIIIRNKNKLPLHRKNEINVVETYTSGCYIATSIYGSYDCPQVWTLRRFRDYTLYKTWYGRVFIKCYYSISPTLVKLFGDTRWFKKFWKSKLDKIVFTLNKKGIDDTCYHDK